MELETVAELRRQKIWKLNITFEVIVHFTLVATRRVVVWIEHHRAADRQLVK